MYLLAARGGDDDEIVSQVIPAQATVTVVAPPPAINVTSRNSVTHSGVSSQWDFAGSVAPDPCNGHQDQCAGSSKVYTNGIQSGTSSDLYYVNAHTNPTSTPSGYAFSSIVRPPIAQSPVSSNPILSFFQGLFNIAKAEITCAFRNGGSPNCPLNNVILVNQGDSGTFILNWDPLAALSVSPTNITINGQPTGSATFNVANVGVPQGSILNWNATPNAGWMTIVPPPNGNINQGAPAHTVTVQGTCDGSPTQGTVTVSGISKNPANNDTYTLFPGNPQTVNVRMPDCAPLPICTLAANPGAIIPPATSTLSYHCINVNLASSTLTGDDGIRLPPLQGSGTTASGTDIVAPTKNTIYTLVGQGLEPGDPYYIVHTSISVTVSKPGTIECNPGAGTNCQ